MGGLGRAILSWMASKGAKHLIAPSRSGGSSAAAKDTVAELRAKGVNIITPQCDVSSAESLAKVLEEYASTMPPIRGCVNASMVLQVSRGSKSDTATVANEYRTLCLST
jgi:NAD(P)-dependent dehydrogenase (short-subunit alcohol dehydrogenase family)